jgi:hypothetical protein
VPLGLGHRSCKLIALGGSSCCVNRVDRRGHDPTIPALWLFGEAHLALLVKPLGSPTATERGGEISGGASKVTPPARAQQQDGGITCPARTPRWLRARRFVGRARATSSPWTRIGVEIGLVDADAPVEVVELQVAGDDRVSDHLGRQGGMIRRLLHREEPGACGPGGWASAGGGARRLVGVAMSVSLKSQMLPGGLAAEQAGERHELVPTGRRGCVGGARFSVHRTYGWPMPRASIAAGRLGSRGLGWRVLGQGDHPHARNRVIAYRAA